MKREDFKVGSFVTLLDILPDWLQRPGVVGDGEGQPMETYYIADREPHTVTLLRDSGEYLKVVDTDVYCTAVEDMAAECRPATDSEIARWRSVFERRFGQIS